MIIWLDAQLPASAAAWIVATFAIEAHAVRDLGLRDAKDSPIFQAARAAGAVVMTKDSDFVDMLQRADQEGLDARRTTMFILELRTLLEKILGWGP